MSLWCLRGTKHIPVDSSSKCVYYLAHFDLVDVFLYDEILRAGY